MKRGFIALFGFVLLAGVVALAFLGWSSFNKSSAPLALIDTLYVTSCSTCDKVGNVTTCDGRAYSDYCTSLGHEIRVYSCRWEGIHGEGSVEVRKYTAPAGYVCADGALVTSTAGQSTTTQSTTTHGTSSTTRGGMIIEPPKDYAWPLVIAAASFIGTLLLLLAVLGFKKFKSA
jgi:hypothetical protein